MAKKLLTQHISVNVDLVNILTAFDSTPPEKHSLSSVWSLKKAIQKLKSLRT